MGLEEILVWRFWSGFKCRFNFVGRFQLEEMPKKAIAISVTAAAIPIAAGYDYYYDCYYCYYLELQVQDQQNFEDHHDCYCCYYYIEPTKFHHSG